MVNNEQISITVNNHSCRSLQVDCPRRSISGHCSPISLSRSKQLNTMVAIVSHVEIKIDRHKDSNRIFQHFSRDTLITGSRHDGQCTGWIWQRLTRDLMKIEHSKVEMIVHIKKQTTACRGKKKSWRDESAIQCPSVYLTISGVLIDEDLLITGDEDTERARETGGNGFCRITSCIVLPDKNLTIVTSWHDDGVLRRDEESERSRTDDGCIGKSSSIRTPRGIGTEFWLIVGNG